MYHSLSAAAADARIATLWASAPAVPERKQQTREQTLGDWREVLVQARPLACCRCMGIASLLVQDCLSLRQGTAGGEMPGGWGQLSGCLRQRNPAPLQFDARPSSSRQPADLVSTTPVLGPARLALSDLSHGRRPVSAISPRLNPSTPTWLGPCYAPLSLGRGTLARPCPLRPSSLRASSPGQPVATVCYCESPSFAPLRSRPFVAPLRRLADGETPRPPPASPPRRLCR